MNSIGVKEATEEFIKSLNDDEEFRKFAIEYIEHRSRVDLIKQDLAIIEKSDEANMLSLLNYYNECLTADENESVKKILSKSTEDTKDLIRSGIIHSLIFRRWLKEEEEIVAKLEEKLNEYTDSISRKTMEISIKIWFDDLNTKLQDPSVKETLVSDTYAKSFIDKTFINKDDPIVHSIEPILKEYIKFILAYDPEKDE